MEQLSEKTYVMFNILSEVLKRSRIDEVYRIVATAVRGAVVNKRVSSTLDIIKSADAASCFSSLLRSQHASYIM